MAYDYEKYRNNELVMAGFIPEDLTDNQKNMILEPSEAPENYMCDGEITQKQAFSYWKQKLKKSGLTPAQVKKAVKHNFG
jgi:hypothetical protein